MAVLIIEAVVVGLAAWAASSLQPKAKPQDGPRLHDLQVQTSTYGNAVPKVYGSMRLAGNVIWSTPKIETQHISGGGGKGGGGQPKQTSYTYSISFAVAICEGPITGLSRIWANGNLIYDINSSSPPSNLLVTSGGAFTQTIYLGSSTQNPDPLMQSYLGAGNTPAYRDTAYIVFENFQLANFGNQLPNLEFEVVVDGTPQLVMAGTFSIPLMYSDLAFTRMTYITSTSIWWFQTTEINSYSWNIYATQVEKTTGAIISRNIISNVSYQPWQASLTTDRCGCAFSRASPNNNGLNHIAFLSVTGVFNEYICPIDLGYDQLVAAVGGDYIAAASSISSLPIYIWNLYTSGENPLITIPNNEVGKAYYTLQIVGTTLYALAYYSVGSNRCWIETYDVTTGNLLANYNIPEIGMPLGMSVDSNGEIYIFLNTTNFPVYVVSQNVTTLYGNIGTLNFTSSGNEAFFVNNGIIYYGQQGDTFTNANTCNIWAKSISNSTPTVASIVSDLCTSGGLTSSQIDVTQLTDTLNGYLISKQETARASIEPLMNAFYFDAVESGGVVKFIKRGQNPVVSIPEDDLAAHHHGATLPDQLMLDRKQELDLPMEVAVSYMDINADYLTGTQYSRRLITQSTGKVTLQVAMAITAAKAKQIADVMLYTAWTGRTSFKFAVGSKYAFYEPTDVVQVTKGASTYTMRLTQNGDSQGIYDFDAVLEDIQVYNQNAVAPTLPATPQTLVAISLTDLLILDIPLLRDQDELVGVYMAACGYTPGWQGAQTFKSSDNGASWSSYGNAMLNPGTLGSTTSILGNFSGGNTFDETNSVTVSLVNGQLSSTQMLNVLNGSNVALVGNEIVQFKNAVLVSPGVYTLSGLLRGRQGTERAMGSHVIGERFVLLASNMIYLEAAPSSEYNIPRSYAAVTFGGYLADAQQINFTNTAVAEKPYAPVLLGGGRDAAGNATLIWTRRTRIGGAWVSYTDAQLGETVESYDVEIMSGTTVKRTFAALPSPTASYTSAEQVADFGANQAHITFNVYQNSSVIGRGFVSTTTV